MAIKVKRPVIMKVEKLEVGDKFNLKIDGKKTPFTIVSTGDVESVAYCDILLDEVTRENNDAEVDEALKKVAAAASKKFKDRLVSVDLPHSDELFGMKCRGDGSYDECERLEWFNDRHNIQCMDREGFTGWYWCKELYDERGSSARFASADGFDGLAGCTIASDAIYVRPRLTLIS